MRHPAALSWSLMDPAHVIVTEGESRGHTRDSQGPPRLHQVSLRLHQLLLTLDTCRHKTSWSINSHIPCFSHSPPLTDSRSLFLYELPFKIATSNTQLSTYSMVRCLCSVLFPERDHLGILGLEIISQLQGRGWAALISGEKALFACPLSI